MARRGYDDEEIVQEVLRQRAENPELSERQLIMSLMKDDGLRRIQGKVKAARESLRMGAESVSETPPEIPVAPPQPQPTILAGEALVARCEECFLVAAAAMVGFLLLAWHVASPAITSTGLAISYGELSLASHLWGLSDGASLALAKIEWALSHPKPAVTFEEFLE